MKNRFLNIYETVEAYKMPSKKPKTRPTPAVKTKPSKAPTYAPTKPAEAQSVAMAKSGPSLNYTVPGVVPVIAQPSNMTCWATVYTILESWRRQQSISFETALGSVSDRWLKKFKNNQGLGAREKKDFIADTGLVDYDPFNPSIQGWHDMLQQFGPIWVTTNEAPNNNWAIHARVIIGIKGDGTPSGTKFTIIDPAGGRKYEESIAQFWPKFEDEMRRLNRARVQILHWPDTAISQSIHMLSLARQLDTHSLRNVIYTLGQMVHGTHAMSFAEQASLQIAGSVGKGGTNKGADVRAIKTRLHQLGYNWITVDDKIDAETIRTIRLFQSIIKGKERMDGDGRVDAPGNTLNWLQATNAPKWQQMPKAGKGFVDSDRASDNKADGKVPMNFGTSWLIDTVKAAGTHFENNHRKGNADIMPIATNDLSLAKGGDTKDHGGHETGMVLDIRVPRNDKKIGGINISDKFKKQFYDQDAARAILKAFKAQPLVTSLLFNDQDLINEGLCTYAKGHYDHIHIKIKAPAIQTTTNTNPAGSTNNGNGHDKMPTAKTSGWTAIRSAIISTAKAEEKQWSNTDGTKKTETESSVRSLLEKYWGALFTNSRTINNKIDSRAAWSAAFVCWVMEQAGVTASHGFKEYERHVVYIVEALKNVGDTSKKFHLKKPKAEKVVVGDIICLSNSSWLTWAKLEQYKSETDDSKITGSSHCDIVVDTVTIDSTSYAVAIGGNIGTHTHPGSGLTAGKKYFELDADGKLTGSFKIYKHDSSGNRTSDTPKERTPTLLGLIKVAN